MYGRRIKLTVTIGTVLILATLIVGSALVLRQTKESALHAANTTLQSAALVTGNTINRELLQVDSVLTNLPALFSAVGDPGGGVDQQSAARVLQSLNFATFAFRDLMLVRPDNTVWASARRSPRITLSPVSISDQTSGSPTSAVVVHGPIHNPFTGEWSWYLSRQVMLPDAGRFYAVAEVPVPFITALLAPVGEIPGLHIDIERPDGTLLASLPHDELKLGKRSVPSADAPNSPVIAVAWQTLYPDVRLTLSLDLAAVMADWTRDRNRLMIVVTVAGVLVSALAMLLYMAVHQRARVDADRTLAHDMLDNAIESMSDGFVMWDEQDRLVTCNQRYREIYALSAAFIKPGAHFTDIIREGAKLGQYPHAGDDVEAFVRDTVERHHGGFGTAERRLPGGKWILVAERPTRTGGIVGIRTDITALKDAQARLAEANERASQAIAEAERQNLTLMQRDHALDTQNVLFVAALNNMSQGLLMVDSDHRLIVCNDRFLDAFRLKAERTLPGMSMAELFQAIEADSGMSAHTVRTIYRQQNALATSRCAGGFIAIDDDAIALDVSQCPLSGGGWVATYGDVTEQQRKERLIRFVADHDALTSLPNRAMFRRRLDEALNQVSPDGDHLALLYLDLDKFKYINDTLGHPAGDALLEAAALRLRNCVRESDLVARLGGDEFATLYLSPALPDAAAGLAQRIIETLSAPYQLDQRQVEVGVSIGIAIASGADIDGDTLLRNADMALYQAKANGRGTYAIFESDMEVRLRARLTVEAELRIALERSQFELYYQPVYDVQTGRSSGFEALLRWNHPTRGLVSPGQFVPLAEDMGLIRQIGGWIVRQACLDAVQLMGNDRIAVNLSPVQLEDDEIVGIVGAALAESGLNPARLELEITETALLNDSAATTAILHRLSALGLTIALDDFGTGYSSLSYLRCFPFDTIKIDRSFVSEMATRDDCAAIVNSIVSLASKLGMRTVAEGVETEEQLKLVRDAGCTAVQGYLLARPWPRRTLIEYFERQRGQAAVDRRQLVEAI